MQSANWLRAGGVGLIVVLLAPACDDNSPMGPTAIPAGDPAAPLLAVIDHIRKKPSVTNPMCAIEE